MEETNYTVLDWRWARDGLLDIISDEPRPADEVARELGLDARAVYVLLAGAGFEGVEFVPNRGTHLVFARDPG